MDWRPFETAPTDETEIIVYRPDAGVFIAESRWMDDDDGLTWFTSGGSYDLTGDLPTHWMPLPEPPQGCVPRKEEA